MLHAIEWLADEEPRPHTHFNVPEYRQHLVDQAHERLQATRADVPHAGCDVNDLVVVGRAYRQVLEAAAAQEADLIVMGAQGRGGLGLTLFGSTTQQVVRSATCPVLTVRG